jgi:hypothetical protein
MGCSIGIRARSKKLQKQMTDFLAVNFRSWSEVIGKGERFYNVSPPNDDLDYDSAKNVVGFNYSCSSGWERFYTSTMCRWLALKVGTRKSRFAKDVIEPNVLPEPAPFMVYDGYQAWPVIVATVKEARKLPIGQRCWATSPLGLPTGPERFEEVAFYAAENDIGTDVFETFQKELVKADIDNLPHEERVKTHQRIMAKCFKPQITKGLKTVETEIRRLDKAWMG